MISIYHLKNLVGKTDRQLNCPFALYLKKIFLFNSVVDCIAQHSNHSSHSAAIIGVISWDIIVTVFQSLSPVC